MQPRYYYLVLRKRWPLIAIVVVAAVVASYLFTRLQTPVYRATAFLTVLPARIGDYGTVLAVQNEIRLYARQIQTDKLAQQVNDRLLLDLSPETLRGKLHAAAITDELLLSLEVDDTDPNRARDIVFAWADEFARAHQDQIANVDPHDRIEVELLDKPGPAVLNWPKRNQIVLAAGVLGVLVGALLAFALEYLDDTMKSSEDVDRFVGSPVLAAIPPSDGALAASSNGKNGHERGTRDLLKTGGGR